MRANAVRVVTNGSVWWFDEDAHEYFRLPKNEAPRERPEWSDERAGVLQDAVWHPYVDYRVDMGEPRAGLYILQPGGSWSYAPITEWVDW